MIIGRDEAKLDRAREETPGLLTRQTDIASETDAAALFDWIAETLGGLDVLVNNAGLFRGYELSSSAAPQMSAEDIEINVLGTVRMTRLALPLLAKSSEGAIVFVSSSVALGAVPRFSVYGATKAAVHSFARSLRAELAGNRPDPPARADRADRAEPRRSPACQSADPAVTLGGLSSRRR